MSDMKSPCPLCGFDARLEIDKLNDEHEADIRRLVNKKKALEEQLHQARNDIATLERRIKELGLVEEDNASLTERVEKLEKNIEDACSLIYS